MIDFVLAWKADYDTKQLFNRQVKVFILLFLGYASLHCMRTGWSFTQKYIQDDLPEFSDSSIGLMDTAFLLFLGLGLYFFGHLSDKFNPKSFLLFGMVISASSVICIGLLRVFFIDEVFFYIILQAINGLFESACLPGYMRMLGNWFSSENRGLLLGIWSGCRSFGDTFGLLIADLAILRLNFRWYWALVLLGGICMFMAYIIWEFLAVTPSSEGLATIIETEFEDCSIMNPSVIRRNPPEIKPTVESSYENNNKRNSNPNPNSSFLDVSHMTDMDADDLEKMREKILMKYGNTNGGSIANQKHGRNEYQSITVVQALQIPGVLWYTLDFMCLKALNYGILFWLPKFLQQNNLENESSGITIMWSLGVLIGGIFSGVLGDRLHKRRAILMPPSLLLLIVSLAFFDSLDSQIEPTFIFYITSFFIGIFLGGPYNVQHGPLLIDLGKHATLQGNQQAIGTVTGIIEGAGSLSSAVVQLAIPYFGQQNIFVVFIVISVLAITFIFPIAVEDFKYLRTKPTLFKPTVHSPKINIISRELQTLNEKLLID